MHCFALIFPLAFAASPKGQAAATPPPKFSLDLATCKGAKQLTAADIAGLKDRFATDAWLQFALARARAIVSCELAVSEDGGDTVFKFADGSFYETHNHADTWTRKLYLHSGFRSRAQAVSLLKTDVAGKFLWNKPHETVEEVQGVTHGHGRVDEFRDQDPDGNDTLSITFDGDTPLAIEDDGAA